MSLRDKISTLSQQAPFSPNKRATWVGQNNKRTRMVKLRISADVEVTVAGTLVLNDGSVLSLLDSIGLQQGSEDMVNFDARMLRHYAEFGASSRIPARRLTAAEAAAKATYSLFEEVYMALAYPFAASRFETLFKELNPQNQLTVWIQQGPAGVANLTDATCTVTNLAADVVQIYDEDVSKLPLFVPYLDVVQFPVSGAIANGRIDLRGSDYLAAIVVQTDSDKGEQADIINSLAYRGDGVDIIGPEKVTWLQLVDGMPQESGGAGSALNIATAPKAWFVYNHIKDGRLSALIPPNQIPNLRLEVNAQPTAFAGATSTTIRVGRVQYRRDLRVCDPVLPFPVTG
jgi:hypothetical protein